MLTSVVVTPDVMSAYWAHALITEKEEIMGLLLGKMVKNTLIISAMKVVRRLTKQKDRVEIKNSDLLAGAEFAESLHGSLSLSALPLRPFEIIVRYCPSSSVLLLDVPLVISKAPCTA